VNDSKPTNLFRNSSRLVSISMNKSFRMSSVLRGSPTSVFSGSSRAARIRILLFVAASLAPSVVRAQKVAPTLGTALVRHAPTVDGTATIEGSVQQMLPESVTLRGNAVLTDDLLLPGTPSVMLNGHPTYGGTLPGIGAIAPTNHQVTLNGNARLGHVRTRTDAVMLPTVSTPPLPAGTRTVIIKSSSDSPGDFATVRNLTLNANVGQYAVPPGTYGDFTANSGAGFTLGIAGALRPVVYNFQKLTLTGQAGLRLAGPVIVNLANGFVAYGTVGSSAEPTWLAVSIYSGDFTITGQSTVFGYIAAPNGTIAISGQGQLTGGAVSDRLSVSGGGLLRLRAAARLNQSPLAIPGSITTDEDNPRALTLAGTDPDGDPLTYAIATPPLHGALTLTPGTVNSYTYDPEANYYGSDSFAFTVSDGSLVSAPATVSITVIPINDCPVADPQRVPPLDEDTSAIVILTGSDIEGSPLAFRVTTSPSHGVLSLNSALQTPNSAVFTYTPDLNYNGPDSFAFTVSDNELTSEPATVLLAVSPINDLPVVSPRTYSGRESSPISMTLLGSDADGDPLVYTIASLPTNGSLSVVSNLPSQNGVTIIYTSRPNFSGTDSFTYWVSDQQGPPVLGMVTVSVDNPNDPPVAIPPPPVQTDEDVAATITLGGADRDGDALAFAITSYPHHGRLSGSGADRTYVPELNYNGPDSFAYTVSDREFTSSPATVAITVKPVNDRPVAIAPPLLSTPEDTPLPITLSGVDVENATLTYIVVDQPRHGTLVLKTGTLNSYTYSPSADYNGPDSFTFKVNDGELDSDSVNVPITVTPVNDPPVGSPLSLTTLEDMALPIDLAAIDVDSAVVGYEIGTPPQHGVLKPVTGSLNAYTYVPQANYHGADSFTFIAKDSESSSQPATVSIDISSVNDVPEAKSQSVSVLEDGSATLTLEATDADGDQLDYILVTQQQHGTLVRTAGTANSYSYSPRAGYSGPDSFDFTAIDPSGAESSPATVSITVVHVNHPPTASPQSFVLDEDTTRAFVVDVNDPDGDALSYTIVSQPADGLVTGIPTDPVRERPTLTYRPNANFFGRDSFKYRVSDLGNTPVETTVTFDVTPINDAPVANAQAVVTAEDTPLSIVLAATDAENDPLTYSIVVNPSHGTLVPIPGVANAYTYSPEANYYGPDSFSFTARDRELTSMRATVAVTVTPVNDAPVVALIAPVEGAAFFSPFNLTLSATATDVDGTIAKVEFFDGATQLGVGTLTPPSTYTLTIPFAAVGAHALTAKATDDIGGATGTTESDPVTITVKPNVPPVIAFTAPISFDDPVNTTSIRLVGTITAGSAVQLTINGAAVGLGAEGAFDWPVALPNEGANFLTIVAEDALHQKTTQTRTVYRITQAPGLALTYPVVDPFQTRVASVQIAGTVGSTATQLFVNSTPVSDFANGSFSHSMVLVPGNNTVLVEARDALGNARTLRRTIVLDQTPPTIMDVSPQTGFVTKNPHMIVAGRVVDGKAISINGVDVPLGSDGSFSSTIVLAEGVTTITLRATDALGNSATVTIKGQLDTIAPVVSINTPSDGALTNAAAVEVSGTVDDPVAVLSIDSASVANNAGAFVATIPLTSASTTITVQARDAAGNVGAKSVAVRRDASAPNLAFTAPANGSVTTATIIRVAGTVDDLNAIVAVNGRSAVVSDGRFEIADFPLAEGRNVLSAIATDSLGNASASVSVVVTSDKTAPAKPSVTAPAASPAYIKSDRVTLTGTSEPGAAVSIVGGLLPVTVTADTTGVFTAMVLVNSNKTTDLFVRGTDAAGNAGDPLVFTVISDTVLPVITLTRPAEGASFDTSMVEVVGAVADTNRGLNVTINGKTVPLTSQGQFGCRLSLSDGAAQSILVTAVDLAGNQTQLTRTVAVADAPGDTKPPSIVVLDPAYDAAVPAPRISVTVLVADESPLTAVTVGGNAVTLDSNGLVTTEVTVDANGEFTIVATDSNGLTTSLKHRVQVNGSSPAAATIQRISPDSPTAEFQIVLYGAAQPGLRFEIVGGLVAKQTGTVGSDGKFVAMVALIPNTINHIQVTVSGANGLASPAVSADVVHDSIPPQIVSTTPATSATNVPLDSTIRIVFSEPIRAADLSNIQVRAGSSLVTYVSSLLTDSRTVTLTPSVSLGQSSAVQVTVPATLSDLAGNAFGAAWSFNFKTIDTQAPAAPVLDPVPARTNQVALKLTGMAEPLCKIVVSGAAAAQPAYADAQGHFAVAITLKAGSVNNLVVTVVDAAGNVSPAQSVTVTHSDQSLVLQSSMPADGAANVAVDSTLSLTFNNPIDPASLGGVCLVGSAIIPTIVSANAGVVSLVPTAGKLETGKSYEIVIPATIADLFGSRFGATRRIAFATVQSDSVAVPIVYTTGPAGPTNLTTAHISGYSSPGTGLQVSGGASAFDFPVSGTIDSTGMFTLDVPLALNAQNTIVLRARDAQGKLSSPVTALDIRQDSQAPTVVTTLPISGAANVDPHSALFIEFSEAVQAAPFSAPIPAVRLFDANNVPVSGSWVLSSNARSVTFYSTSDLPPEVHFKILVGTAVRDLAGNGLGAPVEVSFTTAAASAVARPAAPVLDAVASTRTTALSVTLTGSAPAGSQVRVYGGQSGATASVGSSGRFSVEVALVPNSLNPLAVVADVGGAISDPATITFTQLKHASGIRILSPQPNHEYNNQSITVAGIIDDPDSIASVSVGGVKASLVGRYFFSQVVLDAAPGAKSVTAVATLNDASALEDSVAFSLLIEPVGVDTKPPIPRILFPEEGDVLNGEVVETLVTVEEGVQLTTVDIDHVVAHGVVGNIFFILAHVPQQGGNAITVNATDAAGLVGSTTVNVVVDSVGFASAPVVSPQPSVTNQRTMTLPGSAEPGSTIVVMNGLVPVRTIVPSSGVWSVVVPLVPNATNHLTIVATDAAGNISPAATVDIVHDDARPVIVSHTPFSGETGVPENTVIEVSFSEALNPASVTADSAVVLRSTLAQNIQRNVLLSADGKTIRIVPTYKFLRGDTITVALGSGIADLHGFSLGANTSFAFATAVHRTTVSGIVIDPNLRPLANVKVGIKGSKLVQSTSSFGTFLLDDAPVGDQILYVDARPDSATGIPPQGDARVFNYLEFLVPVHQDADNGLGRPIFMVDTDFSTATQLALSGDNNVLTFTPTQKDLTGFSIIYRGGFAHFADGTMHGQLTATRIDPANIPDRLPSGAIPHFLVEIGADGLTFDSAPAQLGFPNVYNLPIGGEVIVFHFRYGVHNYAELGRGTVGADNRILTGPVLPGSGFVGIVPADKSFDLTRTYLEGRVVDARGRGLAGVSVNAIAGGTYVVTDAAGKYSIPMPEVRLALIRTFATVSTDLGARSGESPSLVFQSALAPVSPSGVTAMPDIVVDSFFLGGSIRYTDVAGEHIPVTGLAYTDAGELASIDDATVHGVDILVYRRIGAPGALLEYDSQPYMRTTASLERIDNTYDASFSLAFLGSLGASGAPGSNVKSQTPGPGDIVKIVAFDRKTGCYAETDLTIPSAADANGGNTSLDVIANLELRPPQVSVDINRVFFLDGIRRRANVPHRGIAFTGDEFVEFKTTWRTPATKPLDRPEISLSGRLRVSSVNYQTDYPFPVRGGEHFRVLELREAIFPDRLAVLQRETDVGIETVSISRDGSFVPSTLLPIAVRTDTYGLAQAAATVVETSSKNVEVHIVDLKLTPRDDGYDISGRFLPGSSIAVGGISFTADGTGRFGQHVAGSLGSAGTSVRVGNSLETRFGEALTPVINQLTDTPAGLIPSRGAQAASVVVNGAHFSPVATDNKVDFNGAAAQVQSASETQLIVIVPELASSGDVTVTIAGKRSNGVRFDFLSVGVNNGSFEDGTLRAWTLLGSGDVVERWKNVVPSDRRYLAFIDTMANARDGVSVLTSDAFEVPAGMKTLLFDYNVVATALLRPVSEILEVYIVTDTQTILVNDLFSTVTLDHHSPISGFDRGSGFRTGAVLVDTWAGTGARIRFRALLKGRGALPDYIPGMNRYDQNPTGRGNNQGTGLFLDNVRLSAGVEAALPPIDSAAVSIASTGTAATLTSGPAAVPAGARVFLSDMVSGELRQIDAGDDGRFSFSVPFDSDEVSAHFLISYATPAGPAGRMYSPQIKLEVVR
jgi:hypothetical protein